MRGESEPATRRDAPCLLRCQRCGTELPGNQWHLHCPHCGTAALLATQYAAPLRLRGEVDSFSSYANWLPYENQLEIPGPRMATIEVPALAARLGIGRLWVAISGHAPHLGSSFETGTFKECEALGVLNRVREQTRKTLIVASAGNAGRAFLELSAQYGEPVIVVMPASARPHVKQLATRNIPPLLVLIEDSNYPDAIRFVDLALERYTDELVREGGCFNVARRDSMGVPFLRAIQAIGHLPSWYVQAVGSGTGAIAAWEGARRLVAAGEVVPAQMRLLLVQNAPFAPMVDAWQHRTRQLGEMPAEDVRRRLSQVAARVLSNATPPYGVAGGVYDALVDTTGEMVAVDNAAVFAAQNEMAREIDFRPCEAAATAYAGLKNACSKRIVGANDEVLLHLTGGGIDVLRDEGAVRVPPAHHVHLGAYDGVFETIRHYLDAVRRER